ncbi:MAG: DUF4173 domain-containing protein [Porphyrobacter sp.]|nr:DUF4173 domain-containing protein [Porphyrobacter sp.]
MPLSAFSFRSSFLWKLGLTALLVGIGDWLFYRQGLYGAHIGFYAVALVIGLVAGNHAVRQDRRAWACVLAAAVFAFALVYDTSLLAWCLLWISATIAALIPATARFGDGWQWFQRVLWQSVRGPFAPLFDLKRASKARRRTGGYRFGLRAMLPIIALPLAGSIVILALFSAANPVLKAFLYSAAIPDLAMLSPLRIGLWIGLFITVWGLLRARLARRILPTFDGRGDLSLPGVSVASVTLSLVVFNLLFALQNVLDIAYFSGLAELPDMTMAQYAHRGAYPLIATALLAAAFVLVTLRPGSTTAAVPSIRWLVVLWIFQNLLLVAFSIERTLSYVQSYSLTELRIAALVWMLLVGFGLVAICWRMLRDRSSGWLINVNMAAAALVLTLASFVDLGAVAASWNVRHAREAGGRGVELDLCYLDGLGDSALLPLIALEGRTDLKPAFRERVQVVRERRFAELDQHLHDGGWTMLAESRFERARTMLAGIPHKSLEPAVRDCDGSVIVVPEIEVVPSPPAPSPAGVTAPPTSVPAPAAALTEEARK